MIYPMHKNVDKWQVIREAMRKEWDPIGVVEFPEAADEYDAYVSKILDLVINNTSKSDIVEYLLWLTTEHMGLPKDTNSIERFANRLLKFRAEFKS